MGEVDNNVNKTSGNNEAPWETLAYTEWITFIWILQKQTVKKRNGPNSGLSR
jgi:hypothetical protein